jgi:hypothetical protein
MPVYRIPQRTRMVLILCIAVAYGAVLLDRQLAAALAELDAVRAAQPHGWIDFNLHHA